MQTWLLVLLSLGVTMTGGLLGTFLLYSFLFLRTTSEDVCILSCACILLIALRAHLAAGGYKRHEDHNNDAGVQAAAKFAVEKVKCCCKLAPSRVGPTRAQVLIPFLPAAAW